MSMKLKILGLGLLALMATSAFAVMNASATVSGHFTHEGPGNSAQIKGEEAKGTSHQLKFYHLKTNSHETDTSKPIECEKATYEGTTATKTTNVIQMFPTYTKCNTEGDPTDSVKVTPEGCSYTFFSHGANTHGTVAIDCMPGKAIKIHHQNCEITVPAQTTEATLTEGITYDTIEETVEGSKVHALTATVTVNTITGHYHSGLCVFLGTNQKFEMRGSVTVRGFDPTTGKQIGITHT